MQPTGALYLLAVQHRGRRHYMHVVGCHVSDYLTSETTYNIKAVQTRFSSFILVVFVCVIEALLGLLSAFII